MGDLLAGFYPWAKTLHILSVISWMAGLLYLPRLFVYHSDAGSKDVHDTFCVMERRLYKAIMTPAMISTWVFGLILAMTPGIAGFGVTYWFYLKFIAVLALSASHGWMGKRRKEFEAGENTRSARTYRFVNEVPTLLMIVIVILVVVKPF